jgi:hypothetical protein
MKLAQYHGPQGKGDNVKFIKGEDTSVFGMAWDRIYITTLFSFEFSRIALGWSPGLRQTVKTLLTVRCKFIVADPGTDLGWACR